MKDGRTNTGSSADDGKELVGQNGVMGQLLKAQGMNCCVQVSDVVRK